MIYLDHNATTQPAPEVVSQIPLWLESWGNPSSIHQAGRGPKTLMRWARQEIASMIGADALEVVFTSCGSESNNLAIKGVFLKSLALGKNHIIVSEIEHPSIHKTVKSLVQLGAEVSYLHVGRDGSVDLEQLKSLIKPTTALISCMLVNNETGLILPIKKIAKIAHEHGVLVHTDAVQALGKMLFSVKDLGVDLASFSGHKVHALRGVGVLFSKRGTVFESLIHGGGQERSRRAGTENILAISSLAAIRPRLANLQQQIETQAKLRNEMESLILHKIPGVEITHVNANRVCNTSSLIVPGVDGEILLMNLDMEGFCVSTGAACSSGSQEPSPALRAIGLSREEAQNSLRLSIGRDTTREEILKFCEVLERVVMRIRKFQPDTSTGNNNSRFAGTL